ncbi:exported hypothetical protein [Gammaproteobacteria bacterium]
MIPPTFWFVLILSLFSFCPAGQSFTLATGWYRLDQNGWVDLDGTQLGAKDTSAILGVNLEWRFCFKPGIKNKVWGVTMREKHLGNYWLACLIVLISSLPGWAIPDPAQIGPPQLPTPLATTGANNVVLLQANSPAIVGAGEGDDTYILTPTSLTDTQRITISDTQGTNLLQLAGGLSIAKSEVSPTALRLTLNNGAQVTILGADAFGYDVGGNVTAGISHAPVSFADLAKNTLGVAVPASGTVNGGAVTVPGSGTAVATPMVAAGYSHTVALRNDGTVVAYGDDSSGQLGLGRVLQSSFPLQTNGVLDVSQVSAGYYHTVALKTDGTVWSWGYNAGGQLGDGSTTNSAVPVSVKNLIDVVAISAGGYETYREDTQIVLGSSHTVALKTDSTVWAWGDNDSGQLGDGTTTNSLIPVLVKNLTKVAALSAGGYHTVALKTDGTVWAWGRNGSGQLGDGTANGSSIPILVKNLTKVAAISAGGYHTVALKTDGTVWAWGSNGYGQLGDGTTTNWNTPVQVTNLTNVTAISAGGDYTVALKTDGTVWAWGSGQLGDGTANGSSIPILVKNLTKVAAISAGGYHTVALKTDGTVWAWGANWYGQLGDDNGGPYVGSLIPVSVKNLTNVSMISAGGAHSVALKTDGTVWTWGDNGHGQLGVGTSIAFSIPISMKNFSNVAAIAAGGWYTVALKTDGTVWAWGNNGNGRFCDGTRTGSSVPILLNQFNNVTAIAASQDPIVGYIVALRTDGTVLTINTCDVNTAVSSSLAVQVKNLTNVSAIAAGWAHTLALKTDGTVWAWGDNWYGQLGDGTTTNSSFPVPVKNLANVAAISAGFSHSVALKTDGTVWAWGANWFGHLGDGTTTDSAIPIQVKDLANVSVISASGVHTLALKTDGTVWAWGRNEIGQLGDGTTTNSSLPVPVKNLANVAAISASWHSVALKTDGTVWAWGMNREGQLGDGTFTDRTTPTISVNDTLDGVLDLDLDPTNNHIPPESMPPFLVGVTQLGTTLALDLSVEVNLASIAINFPPAAGFTQFLSSYVAANAPPGAKTPVCKPQTIQTGSTWWTTVLNNPAWNLLVWPIAPFQTNVPVTYKIPIVTRCDFTGQAGTVICLGYGTSPDEMVAAKRVRAIYMVPVSSPNAPRGDTRCLP